MSGWVVDDVTGDPIGGARVALFAPRAMRLTKIKEAESDFVWQQNRNGGVRTWASWPLLPTNLTQAQLLDLEPIQVFGRPDVNELAVASSVTAADGSFVLHAPTTGGSLVCEHPGYATRVLPAPYTDQEWTIALHRPRPLSGYVIGQDGERLRLPFRLLFYGQVGETWITDTESGEALQVSAKESWVVETDEEGWFEADLPAARVQARIATPGWNLTLQGWNAERQEEWAFRSSFHPGEEDELSCLWPGKCPCSR